MLELFGLFHNDDDRFPKFATKEGDANESRILVAVADDQTLRIFVHGQRRNQFRLAAGFQAKMKLLTRVDDFFNDFAQLIDLDRKNTAISIAIAELGYRALKGVVNRLDTVPE